MMMPSINPRINRVRDIVSEKAVVVAYPESLEPTLRELNMSSDSALMSSIANSVNEKSVIVAYPEGIDAVEQRLNQLSTGDSPLMDSISASVKNKFATYRQESEEQRQRMFPHKDSPFKK